MVWIATDYLARHVAREVACRFDVVGINTLTDPPSVMLIEDAFRPGW
jgi:Holliday junction resolvase-like predicted endonuclease